MKKANTTHSVLIFEDDLDLATQWKTALREKAIQVEHAWSVDAAVAYCNETKFDVIICDIYLTNNDGKQIPRAGVTLMGYLRSKSFKKVPDWGQTVPVIVVTGSPKVNGFDALNIPMSLGGTTSLRKPFTPEDLVDVVLSFLKFN